DDSESGGEDADFCVLLSSLIQLIAPSSPRWKSLKLLFQYTIFTNLRTSRVFGILDGQLSALRFLHLAVGGPVNGAFQTIQCFSAAPQLRYLVLCDAISP